MSIHLLNIKQKFQLTHLLRDATYSPAGIVLTTNYFNSRISCEMRPITLVAYRVNFIISTHASLARCDQYGINIPINMPIFQLTHLLRDATFYAQNPQKNQNNFNSRISCEMRRRRCYVCEKEKYFNSRISCEMRPHSSTFPSMDMEISTHASLARCDAWQLA